MRSQPECKNSLTFGILSIVIGLFIPLIGIVLGIVGLNVTRELNKEDRDFIVSWGGITTSLISFVIAMLMNL